MRKRALVLGSGGLHGAYSAGVSAELCRLLGRNYFDTIYASSVGVFAGTFFAANQPDAIENIWRNHVDGRKLVSFLKPIRGREILDLEYLTSLFRESASMLDVEAVFSSGIELIYALTRYPTGECSYVSPTAGDIFDAMMASSAIPYLHRPVTLGDKLFVDGGLSDPLPVEKALKDGHDQVVAVSNKAIGFLVGNGFRKFVRVAPLFFPQGIADLIQNYETRVGTLENMAGKSGITFIRPNSQSSLRSIIDTKRERINHSVDLGISDARSFVKNIN